MSVNYRSKEFEKAMHEYFDITHTETRRILLNVNESDQNQILSNLTSRLYDNIVNKVDEIDFGDIPNTKGDITKLPNYDKIKDCIKILNDILVQYRQKTDPVDAIDHALTNLELRRELFEKAYRYNVELPIIVYNTIGLSIISAVSLMIATCIEFIKSPKEDVFEITLDKVALNKTQQSLLFTNLKKFNDSCKKGDVDTALEGVIKNNMKNLTGITMGTAAATVAIIGLLFNIIPIMRELIFFFYYSRTRVSDYFDVQADLLQMNANNIATSQIKTKQERDRIMTKQLKIVDMFRKIADKIRVDSKQSEVNTTKDISSLNTQKLKTSDIMDTVPDSASSALF